MRCLVLDDDKNRLKMFEQWLWEPSVELVMVETAEECIQKLQDEKWHVVFLDHDLGGEVYVDPTREDCGSEITRRLRDGKLVQDHRCCFVLHTMNLEEAKNMKAHLIAGGYTNVFFQPFTQIMNAGGPQLREES